MDDGEHHPVEQQLDDLHLVPEREVWGNGRGLGQLHT